MRSLLLALATAALSVSTANAAYGMDIASPVSESQFACLKNDGITFVVTRAWHSYGGFDSESVPNIKAAQAAGLTAGAYLFPCAGKPAADQVKATVAGLSGVHIDRLWFDIETNPSTGCGWSSDHATNCAYMGELLSAGKSLGVTMGIYASEYMWSGIMGSDCTVGASYALWYAHYDNNPSFSDFTSFGGWHTPYAKQYNDNGSACSASYDKNWMP